MQKKIRLGLYTEAGLSLMIIKQGFYTDTDDADQYLSFINYNFWPSFLTGFIMHFGTYFNGKLITGYNIPLNQFQIKIMVAAGNYAQKRD